jgi:peptidoglycan hydrolase-like protein with peptidoglycan-binding domain
VVWAQEHLLAAGQPLKVNGTYDAATEQAVRNFQTASILPVTGQVDLATWPLLLRNQPAVVDWSAGARVARLRGRARTGPASARLRAVRNELGR